MPHNNGKNPCTDETYTQRSIIKYEPMIQKDKLTTK